MLSLEEGAIIALLRQSAAFSFGWEFVMSFLKYDAVSFGHCARDGNKARGIFMKPEPQHPKKLEKIFSSPITIAKMGKKRGSRKRVRKLTKFIFSDCNRKIVILMAGVSLS